MVETAKAEASPPTRDRKAHFGELVQVDGSFHDWLESRGPRGSLYTDWKNVYRSSLPGQSIEATQFGRICSRLGIELIGASSPQAKGRVERSHGTNQDRLVKKLRLRKISTHEAVNEYLENIYLPAHNTRFARRPASSTDYHLPLLKSLDTDDTWCHEEKRRVSLDGVVSYRSKLISLTLRRDIPPKAQVLVRSTESGDLRVIYRNLAGREYDLPWTEYTAPERFSMPVIKRAPSTKPHRPGPNHPWRLKNNMDVAMALAERRQTEPPQG